jgi:hypothetical protein
MLYIICTDAEIDSEDSSWSEKGYGYHSIPLAELVMKVVQNSFESWRCCSAALPASRSSPVIWTALSTGTLSRTNMRVLHR